MVDSLLSIFTPGNFEPHSVHFVNNPGLLWFIVSGNALIALAYTLIPLALLYLVRKRKDIMFTPIFFLFAAFIVLCGATHVMHIIIFWYPVYWMEGIVLAATGIVSIGTFFALLYVLPLALKLKSPKQLEEINARLATEIETSKQAEEILRKDEETLRENQELLSAKNDELEKLNKFMVGRELKMTELKQRIRELEK